MKVGSCGPIFIERGAAKRHEELLRDKIRLSEARFRRRERGGFLLRPSGKTRLLRALFPAICIEELITTSPFSYYQPWLQALRSMLTEGE
jgi:hypothetical protein